MNADAVKFSVLVQTCGVIQLVSAYVSRESYSAFRCFALLTGPDGAFITGGDFLMDGGVTAAYWFSDLDPK